MAKLNDTEVFGNLNVSNTIKANTIYVDYTGADSGRFIGIGDQNLTHTTITSKSIVVSGGSLTSGPIAKFYDDGGTASEVGIAVGRNDSSRLEVGMDNSDQGRISLQGSSLTTLAIDNAGGGASPTIDFKIGGLTVAQINSNGWAGVASSPTMSVGDYIDMDGTVGSISTNFLDTGTMISSGSVGVGLYSGATTDDKRIFFGTSGRFIGHETNLRDNLGGFKCNQAMAWVYPSQSAVTSTNVMVDGGGFRGPQVGWSPIWMDDFNIDSAPKYIQSGFNETFAVTNIGTLRLAKAIIANPLEIDFPDHEVFFPTFANSYKPTNGGGRYFVMRHKNKLDEGIYFTGAQIMWTNTSQATFSADSDYSLHFELAHPNTGTTGAEHEFYETWVDLHEAGTYYTEDGNITGLAIRFDPPEPLNGDSTAKCTIAVDYWGVGHRGYESIFTSSDYYSTGEKTELEGDLQVSGYTTLSGLTMLSGTSGIDHTHLDNIGSYTHDNLDTFMDFFNGTILESFDALATSDGTAVTLTVTSNPSGSPLTMKFSDGFESLATPATITGVSIGTNDSPVMNFLYITQANKVLEVDSAWPSGEEHIKISSFLLPSAAYVQADGPYITHNWNDHLAGSDGQGHMSHMAERSRKDGAYYISGIAPNGTDQLAATSYIDYVDTDEAYFKATAGIIFQMHSHATPAYDTRTNDIHVVNSAGTAYQSIHNLSGITEDANGNTLNNKYYNVVFWGVGNKGGEYAPVMMNLPTGSYNNISDAQADLDGYDVYTIPSEFTKDSSTGFLIARVTIRNLAHFGTVDLRGLTPTTATGGATGAVSHFADNNFTIFDADSVTRIIDFEAGNITAGNTRTITMADADIDLADVLTEAWVTGNTIDGQVHATSLQSDAQTLVGSYLSATTYIEAGTNISADGALYTNNAGGSNRSRVYFWNGTPTAEYLQYHTGNTEFNLTDSINVAGGLTATTITSSGDLVVVGDATIPSHSVTSHTHSEYHTDATAEDWLTGNTINGSITATTFVPTATITRTIPLMGTSRRRGGADLSINTTYNFTYFIWYPSTQPGYMLDMCVVPDDYVTGTQITLSHQWQPNYKAAPNAGYMDQWVEATVRNPTNGNPGNEALSGAGDSFSTDSGNAVTWEGHDIWGYSSKLYNTTGITLTDASGQIEGYAVQPGDQVGIEWYWSASTTSPAFPITNMMTVCRYLHYESDTLNGLDLRGMGQ